MHVPSITFDVKFNQKQRQLIMTKGGIHCRKKDNWRSDVWYASVSELLRIAPHPEKKSSVRIMVVNTYEVDASDPQQALRILGAAKNLDLGQKKVGDVHVASYNGSESKENASSRRSNGGVGRDNNHLHSSTRNANHKLGERGSIRTKNRTIDGSNQHSSSGDVGHTTTTTRGIDSMAPSSSIQHEGKKEPNRANKMDFQIIRPLGKGSFGEVSLVKHLRTNETYAMKVMKKADCEELYDDVYSEMKILAMLSHPFIVGMHFWFEDSDQLYYILDFVPGGELYHHLLRRRRFSEPVARFYMAEIVLALEYLHKDGIMYRDLKPENLLLDADGHIKMTDFGLSKSGITSVGDGAQTFCGTPQYLAPEILRGVEHGTAVDWWSAGVVLYEMVTGSTPFQSSNRKEMYTKVVKGHIAFPYFVSSPCKSFIRGLLVRRPRDRLGSGPLGINEIKAQEFFSAVDWDALLRKQIKAPYIPASSSSSSSSNQGVSLASGGGLNKQGAKGAAATAMTATSKTGQQPAGAAFFSNSRQRSTLSLRTPNPRPSTIRLANGKESIKSSEAAGISHRLDSLLSSISKRTDSPKKPHHHHHHHHHHHNRDGANGVRTSFLDLKTKVNEAQLNSKGEGSESSTGSDSWFGGGTNNSSGKKSPHSNTKIDGLLDDMFK